MRAREVLQEDYNQSLQSDLNNLLIGAKGFGGQQVSTQEIADQLYGMGYSINVNSLLPLLQDNPAVQNATPQMITLVPPEGSVGGGEGAGQDSGAKVSDMAQSATNIG